MRLVPIRSWAFLILSAVLQVAIFPMAGPLPLWRASLAWIALVPLLLCILQPDRSGAPIRPRTAALLGYVCGTLWYAGNCYWIYQTMHIYGGMPEPLAFLILILFALYLGLYHALFAWLLSLVRTSSIGLRGALLLAPFLWVTVELARARITSFPWDLLGYSQIDNSLLTAIAPMSGVMAISFAIAAINAAIAPFFLGRRIAHPAIPVMALCIASTLQFAGSFGHPVPAQPLERAVLMQENIEVGAVGKEAKPLSSQQEVSLFSYDSLHPELPGPVFVQGPANVIVWPEAPSHLISSDPYFRAEMAQLSRTANSAAIIGSLGVDRSAVPARGYYLYDSASLFDAQGDYTGRYDKIHLVPWGEYIPYKQFFSFADKLTEGVGDMDRGHDRTIFTTGGHAYGVFVCYESIFGDEVRHFAANGAEVLVQISDDGWYGDSGAPWQHLNMARMRAIENHRWLLRSTNTGITTVIDPNGRMAAEAPRHVRAAFAFPFAFTPAADTTFYTRHGDWFPWLCALITLAAIVYPRLSVKSV